MHSSRHKDKASDLTQHDGGRSSNGDRDNGELFAEDGFYDAGDIAQVKYEMLRYVANGHSIDEALREFGFSSRTVFYAARAAFERKGLAGLVPGKRSAKSRSQTSGADEDFASPHTRLNSIAQTHDRMQEQLRGFGAALARAFVSDYLEIDFTMRKIRAGRKKVHLTPKEFDLLRYLVSQARKAIPHKELLRAVWGPEYIDQPECLRVCIAYLRKKIEPDPPNPQYILTEPWVGYRFADPSY
jgi:DNA-binding CsgD family transcriptional regulator